MALRDRAAIRRTALIRPFPYPYRAALAICSDIDQTATVDEFLEIQRFLCTPAQTSMGEGVNLEIGNSFYFYDQWAGFSYFTHEERARRVILEMIHTGYIDCLHSYGDLANEREQARRALDVLYEAGARLDVWVNHFGSRNNLSRKFEYMLGGDCGGGDPASPAYHADLTLEYGIRFGWLGGFTRIMGQSTTRGGFLAALGTVIDARYPGHSLGWMGKEAGKRLWGYRGDPRFQLHRDNGLLGVATLEDGQRLHEFVRYCNHPEGIPTGGTSRGLAYVIAPRALERLKAVGGFSIVYAHLGKNSDCEGVIAPESRAALRNLAAESRAGNIYVTTTSKLLNYYLAREYLDCTYTVVDGEERIQVDGIDDPVFGRVAATAEQLQGMTFYVQDSERAALYLGGNRLAGLQRNPVDESGRQSVTIPFTHLSYPYP